MEKCCQSREDRIDGWDDGNGHHEGVMLKKAGGRWHMLTDWFSVDINFCPWCGAKFTHDQAKEVDKVEDISMDELAIRLRKMADELGLHNNEDGEE